MCPYELLGNGTFGYLSEFVEEWPTLKVKIEAISKAQLLLALESVRLGAEGEFNLATAFFVAAEDFLTDLLTKTQRKEAIFYLFLFSFNVFERVLSLVHFHYIKLISIIIIVKLT